MEDRVSKKGKLIGIRCRNIRSTTEYAELQAVRNKNRDFWVAEYEDFNFYCDVLNFDVLSSVHHLPHPTAVSPFWFYFGPSTPTPPTATVPK